MKTKNIITTILIIAGIMSFSACSKDKNIDKEKPVIDISIQDAFPINCDTLYFGESYTLKIRFTDNAELGTYGIEIHHDFEHHSHSTDVEECEHDPEKEPVNPWVFIQDYEIPAGLTEHVTDITLSLPSDCCGEYDEGDYHFFISLTDAEGWSAQKGLSVKIMKR